MEWLVHFWQKSVNDQLGLLSAQIAYTMLLALFPFFIIVIILLNTLQIDVTFLSTMLATVLPTPTVELVLTVIEQTTQNATGLVSQLSGLAVLAMATGMMPLLHALNRVYGLKETRCYPRQYVTSFVCTFLIMTTLVITILFFIVDVYLWRLLVSLFPFLDRFFDLYQTLEIFVPIGLFMLNLTVIYQILPNKRMSWRQSLIAACFSTGFWILITLGFSFYVSTISQRYSQLYGGLAAVIALITWLYFTAFAFLLGIECSYALHQFPNLQMNSFLKGIDQLWDLVGDSLQKMSARWRK